MKSEEKYRDVLDNISDGVYWLNTNGYFTFVNKAITDRLGIPLERFYTLHFLDVVDPKYHDEVRNNFQRVIKGEKVIPYEIMYRDVNGQVRTVEVRSRPIREGGRIVGLLGISRDLTARKQEESKYRTIVNAAIDGFWMTDSDGHFLDVNDAYCRMTGYTREELLTMSIRDVEAEEAPKDTTLHIQHIMEIGYDRFETRHRRKDGIIIDIEVSVNYMIGGRLYTFLRDVTARKKMEVELREHRNHLEELVKERTSELGKVNDQLLSELVEKKRAETALRKKTKELELYSNKLQELNAALKILLQQREEDRTALEEKVLLNVKHLLTPHFEALKNRNIDEESKAILEILESNTKNMTSSFSHKLSSKYLNFTPTEIKVANFVKEGKQIKEIAKIMGVSRYAIELHRFNIRKKLGLKSRKINLQSYLLSLS